MNNNPILNVTSLSHEFSGENDNKPTPVLRDISFDVGTGEFFSILGPSGCGKSTLLRILAGMIAPAHGTYTFTDRNAQAHLSMIFQSFAIFPWLTVYGNVAFGLKMEGISKEKRNKIVTEHLDEVGLGEFAHRYPKDLSGGMKQRVGIARSLALEPSLLLMDEAFSSLDAFTAERLRKDVLYLWLKDKMSIIMVTHLVEEAVEMSDRILVMTPRPGRVEGIIDINLPRPRNKRSPEFFRLVDQINEIVKI